ncbi:hypothetical protein G6K93_32060 [Agrobacterium rhizogenes]|uniref:hypothetical protein n=1 Tax=Rhizobium rhizogenes TaxID=359 RepID=UPI001571D1C5|nr:hypothetical protein [Rhizobium rhizogenes]NTF53018.1 hypothetical protein [Rhizobium rhizogenes]NTF65955.1 hypothetical protein [Rhizobium rhizogenes]NTF98052.1 hypothetical protein [Rhizobium rhizogenes]NTG05177.1 hypothetical protein [Rhizobium rhizogenes]NTG18471.1 hypothetical protein [Rhizobium rhizogenes]
MIAARSAAICRRVNRLITIDPQLPLRLRVFAKSVNPTARPGLMVAEMDIA